MAKNLAWQQDLPLHQIVGVQLLNHLLKLLVNGLAGVQDVIHSLDYSRWHSHGLGKEVATEVLYRLAKIASALVLLHRFQHIVVSWKQPKAESIHD
jgi:hypothetical protein